MISIAVLLGRREYIEGDDFLISRKIEWYDQLRMRTDASWIFRAEKPI